MNLGFLTVVALLAVAPPAIKPQISISAPTTKASTTKAVTVADALAAAPAPIDTARFDGDVVVRVLIRSAQDLLLVNQLSDDMWSHHIGVGGEADFRM